MFLGIDFIARLLASASRLCAPPPSGSPKRAPCRRHAMTRNHDRQRIFAQWRWRRRHTTRGAVAGGRAFRYGLCNAPVAQLDRVPDSESGGHRFKSCRVRQFASLQSRLSHFRVPEGEHGMHRMATFSLRNRQIRGNPATPFATRGETFKPLIAVIFLQSFSQN